MEKKKNDKHIKEQPVNEKKQNNKEQPTSNTTPKQQDNNEEVEVLQEEHFKEPKKEPEVDKLKEEVKKLTDENNKLKEKVQLSQAELINYRKRKDDEVAGMLKYANADLITEILNVLDNLERALNHAEKSDNSEVKKYNEGINMICVNLKSILQKYGVEEINRLGQVFNPNEEQALMTDSVQDKDNEVVLEVLQKGYKLKDRVIRPASVKINQK